jgi:histidinol-phosphate aminotransferase
MSKFFSNRFDKLVPYTPGEQPKEMKYLKLNTNESPWQPSKKAQERAAKALSHLELYSDPDCTELVKKACELYDIEKDEILFGNGSDEILNFAFAAFCDDEHPAVFPDITYGFYPVFANMNRVPYEEKPLAEDFSINVSDYMGINKSIFIANPNAPTGIALPPETIEEIVKSNPNSVVVIDEAYVDFGAKSVAGLIHKYENLLVVQTFSKSRSMAGARLGFAIADSKLIADLNTIKYSTNPYNVGSMAQAAGIGAFEDEEYTRENCKKIAENREYFVARLKDLGFEVLPSTANFVFAKHPKFSGKKLYEELKKIGILVRHFDKPRLMEYNRITIGTRQQMDELCSGIEKVMRNQ